VRLSRNAPTALEPLQISAEVHNTGSEEVLKWFVYAIQADAPLPEVEKVYQGKRLSGGEESLVQFTWTPPAPGQWRIFSTWEGERRSGSPARNRAVQLANLQVAEQPGPSLADIWHTSGLGRPLAWIVMLAGLGLAAAAQAFLYLRGK
jgi:hypothetical protein